MSFGSFGFSAFSPGALRFRGARQARGAGLVVALSEICVSTGLGMFPAVFRENKSSEGLNEGSVRSGYSGRDVSIKPIHRV